MRPRTNTAPQDPIAEEAQIEGIDNLGAPVEEVEAGVALDATTVEAKVVGAMMIEGDA